MAGKPGMHSRTLNPAAAERLRDKIKSGMLIKALEDHVLDGKDMSRSQVAAAVALLKKTVPDLSQVDSAVQMDGNLTINIKRFAGD